MCIYIYIYMLGAGPQVEKKTRVDRPKGGPPTLFGQSDDATCMCVCLRASRVGACGHVCV